MKYKQAAVVLGVGFTALATITAPEVSAEVLIAPWKNRLVMAFGEEWPKAKVVALDAESGQALLCAPLEPRLLEGESEKAVPLGLNLNKAWYGDEKSAMRVSADGIAVLSELGGLAEDAPASPYVAAFDVSGGKWLWATSDYKKVRLGEHVLLGDCAARAKTRPCLRNVRSGKTVLEVNYPYFADYDYSLPTEAGIVALDAVAGPTQLKGLGYYLHTDEKPQWQYANEWGKGPIEAPATEGLVIVFHQDGNVYVLNADGKLVREYKKSYAAIPAGGKRVFVIDPAQGITALNVESGGEDWRVSLASLWPKAQSVIIREVIAGDGAVALTLHGNVAGRDHVKTVALQAGKGTPLPWGREEKEPASKSLKPVGLGEHAVRYSQFYYDRSGEEGVFIREAAKPYAPDFDDQQAEYADVSTGKLARLELPSAPVLVSNIWAYIWNENNGALYAYRFPDWQTGKEVWKSSKADWKCAP